MNFVRVMMELMQDHQGLTEETELPQWKVVEDWPEHDHSHRRSLVGHSASAAY